MTEYKVTQVKTATRQCATCGGTGQTIRRNAAGTFKSVCTASGCRNGKYTIEHRTEISLIDALKELGLIK